jgi:hypothetical protein
MGITRGDFRLTKLQQTLVLVKGNRQMGSQFDRAIRQIMVKGVTRGNLSLTTTHKYFSFGQRESPDGISG